MSILHIAVDGPAGSGKSTVAKIIAERLKITYLDTGAMYRAITFAALTAAIDLYDAQALKTIVDKIDLKINPTAIYVDGVDVTEAIRTPEVTQNVSVVSMDPYVRAEMVNMQRKIASGQSVIMDGRDIGTVVLPDANYKFFLVADPVERAKRRLIELKAKGFNTSLEALTDEIVKRDALDSGREVSPLRKASGAIEIDTTFKTIEEVVAFIIDAIKEKE
ncbi:MAG: (d)CMP kinase [Firmicutes bacterium]|nr:(d)CMP kinase [Bacillota bacterium]